MGALLTYQFRVGNEPSPKLDELNQSTCEKSLDKTVEHVKRTIEKIKNMDVTDMKQTSDYKKYGLLPGQLIKRKSHIGLPHTAVYYWDGIIIEMGSGPVRCAGNLGVFYQIKNNVIGLSTLDQFLKLAKVAKSTNTDSSKAEALKKLNRALEVIGKCSYWFLTNNCFHSMNYIAHGRKYLTHINNFYTTPMTVGFGQRLGKRSGRRSRKRSGKRSGRRSNGKLVYNVPIKSKQKSKKFNRKSF